MDVIDILLSNEPLKAEEKEYKIKRLSKVYKADVIFKLKGLVTTELQTLKI